MDEELNNTAFPNLQMEGSNSLSVTFFPDEALIIKDSEGSTVLLYKYQLERIMKEGGVVWNG